MIRVLTFLIAVALNGCALSQFKYDERASRPGKADWRTLPANGPDTTIKHGPEGPNFGP